MTSVNTPAHGPVVSLRPESGPVPSTENSSSGPATGPASLATMRVLIVGTGLIGTSVGLALRLHGTDVLLTDRMPGRAAQAAERGAGRVWPSVVAAAGNAPAGPGGAVLPRQKTGPDDDPAFLASETDHVDHVVLAVPPGRIGAILAAWQCRLPGATFSDTGSVKVRPIVAARELGVDMSRLCGAHPISGQENSGPDWATADLFTNRPWVLTPTLETSERAVAHARMIVEGCGAQAVEMRPEMHDAALGLLSHLPHVVASAVAARLAVAPEEVVRLAGPGLWDFTRIAGANADLWSDIVAANAAPMATLLTEIVADLVRLRDSLAELGSDEADIPAEVAALFRLGNIGRDRLAAARAGNRAAPAALAPVPAALAPAPAVLAPAPRRWSSRSTPGGPAQPESADTVGRVAALPTRRTGSSPVRPDADAVTL